MENYGNLSPTEIAEMLRQEWLKGQGTITQLPGEAAPSVRKYYKYHPGYDIGTKVGTPVYAPERVEILGSGIQGGYGQRLAAYLPSRNQTAYLSHLAKVAVQPGIYEPGTLLGYTGGAPGMFGAGNTTGPHVEFELYKGKRGLVDGPSSGITGAMREAKRIRKAGGLQNYSQRLLEAARRKNPRIVAISSNPARLEEMKKRGMQIIKLTI